jgi:hypothetical protein
VFGLDAGTWLAFNFDRHVLRIGIQIDNKWNETDKKGRRRYSKIADAIKSAFPLNGIDIQHDPIAALAAFSNAVEFEEED